MALRATPTIAICLTAGVAAGVALARPADREVPVAAEPAATAAPAPSPADGIPDQTTADGDDTAAAGAAAEVTAIRIESFAFSATATVAPGATLEITNFDPSTHTLSARDESFDTGNLSRDQTATVVAPSAPGTYEFFCKLHPSMVGTLTVSS